MGFIFSHQNTEKCFARFENGTVYLGHSTLTCGSYAAGKVYDEAGKLIATYCNNVLYPTDENTATFVVENNCIYSGKTCYACFQGDKDGACAAAYLYYKNQTAMDTDLVRTQDNKPPETFGDTYWSFDDLWKNINERASTLMKVIMVLLLLVVGCNLIQLPAVVAYLLEEDIGLIILCTWGGAFLLGFRRNSYPLFKNIRHVIAWLWEYLLPYLHVSWIVIVIACIYSTANGFFSFSYLAGVLYYLPATILPLTMPLYLINLARSLYLLYKHKR
ncbi:MAG: hypothetical protein IKC95_04535 [Oscillospiraceae bacterium]|nr:hypothetical protein [Oscillospiraceae bacterium]